MKNSKLIALSAISAAFVALLLTIGVYFEFFDLIMLVMASAFVIMPLYYKSFLGALLSYLAGGIIAMILGGFNFISIIFPAYFAFFGLFPIVRHLLIDKKVNNLIIKIIGLIWCVAAIYGIFLYYTAVMGMVFEGLPLWIINNIWYIIGVVGFVFYFVFDRFIIVIRIFLDRCLGRIIK